MFRILITDAVGLVGAYIIKALLSSSEFQNNTAGYSILAGYHTQAELDTANKSTISNSTIRPILVDWGDENTYFNAVRHANAVLLLTPFTSKKVAQTSAWMAAIEKAEKDVHVVHIGTHTDDSVKASERPPHETWNLEAEEHISSFAKSNPRISASFLRINFDGYNTLLRPGKIAYYIPHSTRYGWMAREDIADFAARVLLGSALQGANPHILSTQSISIDEMAASATQVMGFPVITEELSIAEFERVALDAQPGDSGYAVYIQSVVDMFSGLRNEKYEWHKQIFPEQFEGVVKRKPLSFGEWLKGSPTKNRLVLKN